MLKLINGAEKTRDDLMSTNIFFRLHSTTQTLTTHAYSHPYEYTSAEEEVLRKEKKLGGGGAVVMRAPYHAV